MNKIITIGDKEVKLECNAYTPIKYREETGRDLLKEFTHLDENDPDTSVMLDLLFIMAKQGGFDGDQEKFFSQFELLDAYAALPQAMALWTENGESTSVPKKDRDK